MPTHCYELSTWAFAETGGYNQQTIPSLSCTQSLCTDGTGAFITNEMWVGDQSSWAQSACNYAPNLPNTAGCWIESGVITHYNGHGIVQVFFWADMRPCGGSYWWHLGSSDANYIGTKASYNTHVTAISQTDSCNDTANNTWFVESHTFSDSVTQFQTSSTYNPMSPTVIEVGSEVYGTTGESESGPAHQNNMQYYDGSWHAVNPSGRGTIDDAIFSATWTYPDSTNTGDWAVSCTC